MSEQWYWKHGRDLLGPLDTARLEMLIGQHRIADRDQVRLDGDETWLSGAEVKALFAGGEQSASSSAAAARLLSQARKLQNAEAAPPAVGTASLGRLWRTIRHMLGHAGAPVERLGEVLLAGLQRAGRRLTRKRLLVFVAAVLVIVVAASLEFGGDARLRRFHSELTSTWQELDRLQTARASAAELRVLADAKRPVLELQLQTLIRDAQRAPGRSADSFAWFDSADRGWQVAHARNALIHAAQALLSLLDGAAKNEALSSEIFRQHLSVADGLLREGTTGAAARRAGPERETGDVGRPVGIGLILMLDAVFIAVGAWYWLRRGR